MNAIVARLNAAPRGRRGESGQATVEFSLVVVLLLLLMFSIVDFGRMVAIHTATVTASREAARYGAAVGIVPDGYPQYVDCVGIRNAAREVVGGLITIPDSDIVISFDEGPGTSPNPLVCGTADPDAADYIDTLDRIVVQVTVTYRPITPLLQTLVQPVTVVSMDARTIVKADP